MKNPNNKPKKYGLLNATRLRCLSKPPRGMASGGNAIMVATVVGRSWVMAINPEIIKMAQLPSRAIVSSSQTKPLKAHFIFRAAKAPSPIETIISPIMV